jgi:signal transduction histidine kinase/CheY-like chemotaxis protein
LALLLVSAGRLWGQAAVRGLPVAVTPREWPLAQALAVAQLADGELAVAGSRLAISGGDTPEAIPTPADGYAFRALAADPAGRGKVYVGGIGALGCVERDAGGAWRYRSLLEPAVRAGLREPVEVWKVFPSGDGVVAVTDSQVARIGADGAAKVWNLDCRPRLFAFRTRDGRIWLFQQGAGILRMDPDGPRLAYPADRLPPEIVVWGVSSDDGLVVGTDRGVYRVDGRGFERLAAASKAVEGRQPTCACPLDGRRVAVGTYQAGVVVLDLGEASGPGGTAAWEAGADVLPDGRVNDVEPAGGSWVWVATAGGISRLYAGESAGVFDRRNGLARGPVLKVADCGEVPYALTPQGVYRLGGGAADESPMKTVFWDEREEGGSLFVGGYGRIWRLAGGAWEPLYYSTSDVYLLAGAHGEPGSMLFADGRSVRELFRSEGGWASRGLIPELGDEPHSLRLASDGDLWVSTNRNGIWDFARRADGKWYVRGHFLPGIGLPEGTTEAVLASVGGRLVAFTEQAGILELVEGGGERRFAPLKGLEAFEGIAVAGDGPYCLVKRRGFPVEAVIRVEGAKTGVAWRPVAVPGLDEIGDAESVSATADGTLWIGGTRGLMRVAPRPPPDSPGPPPGVSLRVAGLGKNARTFEFSSPPGADGSPGLFETRLMGADDDWSAPTAFQSRAYTGLAARNYVFEVRSVDRWGSASAPAALSFAIPQPWWKTWPMLAGYAAALALAVSGAVRWRTLRLQRQAARLNEIVEERTGELVQRTRELDEKSRELEMANAAKTEFLESISHEIRNPLNGITGLARILNETPLGPAERELASSLGASARALTRAFDDVLNFAKIEHREARLEEAEFDPEALLREVAALFAVQARERGCPIAVRTPGEGRAFVGDAEKIRTILSNFVSNALKYAPGAPVEATLEFDRSDATGADATFVVRDHGPGIPVEEQELVFRKFARGREARRRGEPGVGLGLATCAALSELMGGSVALDSEPGKGAAFLFRLWLSAPGAARPRTDAQAPPDGEGEEAPAGQAPLTALARPGERLLVVEDQSYNRLVSRRIGEQLGFEVDAVGSGKEALEQVRRRAYAAILIDWELPDMEGGDLARKLRGAPDRDGAPVLVATTAHASADVRARSFEAGMDGFVLKPFDPEAIARVIDESFALRGRPRGASGVNVGIFDFVGYGDRRKADEAARAYLAILDREMETLGNDIEGGDPWTISRTAHRLKNHAAVISADALQAAAERLHQRIHAAPPSEREALYREAARQAAVLSTRLVTFLESRREEDAQSPSPGHTA